MRQLSAELPAVQDGMAADSWVPACDIDLVSFAVPLQTWWLMVSAERRAAEMPEAFSCLNSVSRH
jgi:hypothetical protein